MVGLSGGQFWSFAIKILNAHPFKQHFHFEVSSLEKFPHMYPKNHVQDIYYDKTILMSTNKGKVK